MIDMYADFNAYYVILACLWKDERWMFGEKLLHEDAVNMVPLWLRDHQQTTNWYRGCTVPETNIAPENGWLEK